MNRWLLMPKNSPFGDILESSNNVYNTATFDETSKMWSIPLKIPNIFRPDDVSVHIIKDGSMSGENYAVRVSGHSKMENKVDAGKTEKDEKSRAAGSVDEAVDSDKSNDMGQKSLSEYHYEMQFPLPQKIPKYSSNEVKDYLSQIKSKWNKDEGTLTVQIPDWMVCKELAMDAKNKEDEIVFKIPVGLE